MAAAKMQDLFRSTRSRRHPQRGSLVAHLWALVALRRSRARLAHLDAHLLRDIGLTAEDARAEGRRPVWDVPDSWRR